jgi:Arc/MetJ family transcription regulator
MSKVPIDVDDDLLAEAARALGTTTKKATVNGALADVARRARIRRHLDWLRGDGLPDLDKLADPEFRDQAWR